MLDSPGKDVFEAYADLGTMKYADGTIVQAECFGEVHAFASDDGQADTAHLYDTTADLVTSYATWYKAWHGDSKMYATMPIPSFFNRAVGFDEVTASADGSDDVAQLYDAAFDDIYWSRPDHSRMEYGDGTIAEALNFRYMYGYSRNGSDTAILLDQTAGGTSYATHFYGYATGRGRQFTDGYGFYSFADGFDGILAVLGGHDDLVRLYDDPARVDHLVIPFPGDGDHDPAKAVFFNGQRLICVDDFLLLAAFTSEDDVDDEEVDPAYTDEVLLYGDWAEAP